MRENEAITAPHLGALLASSDGRMNSTVGRREVPVIEWSTICYAQRRPTRLQASRWNLAAASPGGCLPASPAPIVRPWAWCDGKAYN